MSHMTNSKYVHDDNQGPVYTECFCGILINAHPTKTISVSVLFIHKLALNVFVAYAHPI